jgi:uncharacterized membrane protein
LTVDQQPDTMPQTSRRPRIESVDLVRGIIMILMALDHVRDFFGVLGANPADLATTTTGLFLTRWVTHICAPVFFLLTGTGAWFSGRRRGKGELARHLLSRGLWLIVLEVTVMRFLLQFNVDYKVTVILVLWALGWSMITLAALLWLPTWGITAFGAIMVVGHNLLDGISPAVFGSFAPLWNVLHVLGFVYNDGQHAVLVSYVLIPWVGVTALGYALGALYEMEAERRQRLLLRLGVAFSVGFVLLRAINVYGDPVPWSSQASPVFTVLSFFNANKYPPSLLFLLMTLGPALLMLRAFDGGCPRWLRPALVFGRVPLFYYIVHFGLIHLLAVGAALIRYGNASGLFQSPSLEHYPFTAPANWPASLPVIYLIWAAVVLLMYPVSRWYAGVKARRSDWWLSYL